MSNSQPDHRAEFWHDKGLESAPAAEEARVTELVAGCQAGNREARRLLYELFHAATYRLLVRMVGLQEAPDLLQEVFLQVFAKIGQFSGHSRFSTWLHRVTANTALQFLRKSRRQRQSVVNTDPADLPAANDRHGQDQELLQAALQKVDPTLRALFLLRELEGPSYREIAQTLGIAEGTVGSRLNRVRRELREHLAALGWEG